MSVLFLSPPSLSLAPLTGYQANGAIFTDTGATTVATNTTAVARWNGYGHSKFDLTQSTSTNRPTFSTTYPSVSFDGSDDYMSYSGAMSDVIGSVVCAFETESTAFSTSRVLLSSADAGTANNWFEIGITAEGKVYIDSNAGGTQHTVVGSTFLSSSTAYTLIVTHDGTDYYVAVGSTEQNPLQITSVGAFGWFGDVSSADNVVMGGTVTSAGLVRPFKGKIMAIEIYSTDIVS